MRHPLYVISKGRADACLTAKFLIKDGVDFKLVVEPQEKDLYFKHFGKRVVTLPFSNKGLGSYPARNWCWEDSIKNGFKKHWILDDNIRNVKRLFKGVRIVTNSIHAFNFLEDLTDNYENIGITGMNYEFFTTNKTKYPIVLNHHVYSNLLIKNDLPFRWRLRYNEDTDLNLQVLHAGYCTLYSNIFLIAKMRTMVMKGGNTDELYKGNGRLRMARMLEAVWPQYVKVKWRFDRPQHVVNWEVFKQGLKPVKNPKKINLSDYGTLRELKPVQSKRLRKILK